MKKLSGSKDFFIYRRAGMVDTGDSKVSNNFLKNSKRSELYAQGPPRRKLIHAKNVMSKISCQAPIN
jgi:hypothetical protein